jgi:hypothetical protein
MWGGGGPRNISVLNRAPYVKNLNSTGLSEHDEWRFPGRTPRVEEPCFQASRQRNYFGLTNIHIYVTFKTHRTIKISGNTHVAYFRAHEKAG